MKRFAIATIAVLGFTGVAAAEQAEIFETDRHNPAAVSAGMGGENWPLGMGVDTMATASIDSDASWRAIGTDNRAPKAMGDVDMMTTASIDTGSSWNGAGTDDMAPKAGETAW